MTTISKTILTITIILSLMLNLALTNHNNDPLAKVFKQLPKNEKEDFLSYFLGLGIIDWTNDQLRPSKSVPKAQVEALISSLNITESKIHKFQDLNIPKESRQKLLGWVKSEFSLATLDVLQLIKSKKCQGSACVTLPDIGEICCPW